MNRKTKIKLYLVVLIACSLSWVSANGQVTVEQQVVAPKFTYYHGIINFESPQEAFQYFQSIYNQSNDIITVELLNYYPDIHAFAPTYNGIPSRYDIDVKTCHPSSGFGCTTVQGQYSFRSGFDCPVGFQQRIETTGPDQIERFVYCVLETIVFDEIESECKTDNPVILMSGEKYLRQVDYTSADGVLRFERTYRSTDGFFNSYGSSYLVDNSEPIGTEFEACYPSYYPGPGSYAGAPVPFCFATASNGNDMQVVVLDSGRRLTFENVGSDTPANDFPLNRLSKLIDSNGNDTWELVLEDNSTHTYDDQGRLIRRDFVGSYALDFTYEEERSVEHPHSPVGRPSSLTDSRGRTLTFSYNTHGRLESFLDPELREYSYQYDEMGNLTKVIYPDGAERTYLYAEEGHINNGEYCSYNPSIGSEETMLTGIIDENGQRYSSYYYDCDGTVSNSELANGAEQILFDYSQIGSGANSHLTLTNSLGKQTTYHYEIIDGVRSLTAVDGHPSAHCAASNRSITHDANGYKDLVTDREGNVTDYDRDAEGRELSRIEGIGTDEAIRINTEWHSQFELPTKMTYPDKIVDFVYDENGNLVSRTESPNSL